MLVSKRQMQKETTSNHRQPLLDSGMRCGRPGYHSTSSKPSSAITGLGYVLAERPRYHQLQQEALVSQYWTKACAVEGDSKLQTPPQQQVTLVSQCWTKISACREVLKPQIPKDLGYQLPALVSHCWTRACMLAEKSRSPRSRRDLQPAFVGQCWTKAFAGREAQKKVGKGSNQRTSLLESRIENTKERDLALL